MPKNGTTSAVLEPPRGRFAGASLSNAARNRRAKAIVYGESGAGKTRLLATAPRPLYVVNVDNSIASLPAADDIFVYPDPSEGRPVNSWQEFEEVLSWLEAEGARQFATVAVDTGTEVGELLRRSILDEEGPARRFHPEVLTQADYGLLGARGAEAFRRIRDLPCHVVVTFQPGSLKRREDTVAGITEVVKTPAFKGQAVPAEIPALFDIIGYLKPFQEQDGKLIRRMLLQPLDGIVAKFRVPPGTSVPVVVEEPNLTELFKLIAEVR